MARKVLTPKLDCLILTLPVIPSGAPVKREKFADVKRLITPNFGEGREENPNLQLYRDIIFNREPTD